MNLPRLALGTVLLAAPLGVGCDGASSARETERKPTSLDQAPAPAAEAAPAAAAPRAAGTPGNTIAIKADPKAPKRDASGLLEASFDDVKFEMDKAATFDPSYFTPQVKKLFGDRIRIRGYMFPALRKRGLKQFVLVRDNLECCFGPGAALYDCILVTMEEGKTTEYISNRFVAVEGTFRYEEPKGPDGKPLRALDGRPLAIYQMVAEAVK
jgi:hypothetical protein